jgi:hypothetical protein
VDVVGLAVAGDLLAAEVETDRPHDLLQAVQEGLGEHRMPVVGHEYQEGVQRDHAVPAFGVATGAEPAPPNRLPGCGVDFGVACSAFVSDEPAPRLMPSSLTLGEQRRLLGLERRKAGR